MLMKVTINFISISFNSVVTKYNVHLAQPEAVKQTRRGTWAEKHLERHTCTPEELGPQKIARWTSDVIHRK